MAQGSSRGATGVDALGALLPFGLLGLLAVAVFFRGLFFESALLPFEMYAAVFLAVVAVYRAVAGRWLPWRHPLDRVALAAAAGYVLSAAAHPVAPHPALLAALRAVFYLGWYWAAVEVMRGPHALRVVGRFTFGSGVGLALVAALAAARWLHFPYAFIQGRMMSTLQYPNALAAWLGMALVAGLALVAESLARPRSRYGQWVLAAYGAGLGVVGLALVGTFSRGGWLACVLALSVWVIGLRRDGRGAAAGLATWMLATGLLLSRAFLGAAAHGASGRAVVVLLAAAGLGAVAPPGYRSLRRAWHRQEWSPAARRAMLIGLGAYAVSVVVFLLVVGARFAAVAGAGIFRQRLVHRVSSIGFGAAGATSRFAMWMDAARLAWRHPWLGSGGGGWEALYHTIQNTLYWSSEAHQAVLQAWIGGGLAAGIALLAVGPLLLRTAWRQRGHAGGDLVWGIGVAGFGLWAHAMIDFDLSIPALALLFWLVVASVRAAVAPDDPITPPLGADRRRGLLGLGLSGVLALGVIVVAGRQAYAHRLEVFGVAAAQADQLVPAYHAELRAEVLVNRSSAIHAGLAQLEAAAYQADGRGAVRARALVDATAALRDDPGNLPAMETALAAATMAGGRTVAQRISAQLLKSFPLDPRAYAAVAQSLVAQGEADLAQHHPRTAGEALRAATRLDTSYGTARRVRGADTPAGSVPADLRLSLGEAAVLVGNYGSATSLLKPVATQQDPVALGWLAAALAAEGQRAEAARLLHLPAGPALAEAQTAQRTATRWAGAARPVG